MLCVCFEIIAKSQYLCGFERSPEKSRPLNVLLFLKTFANLLWITEQNGGLKNGKEM